MRQNVVADERFEGPLRRLIEHSRTSIARHLPTRRALGPRGRFQAVGIIPESVWLEALVNAVIHRSYSAAGDHIRVEIFDDAVVVESPGRFPGVVDIDNPDSIRRYARNPRIARVAADVDYGQELGEGMRRMFEDMRLAGLVQPTYHQTSGSVQVTLSAHQVDAQLEARLPRSARKLLELVRTMDHPSTGDLMAAAALSRPAVLTSLRALEAEAVVERVGKSPNDPRAYWRLADRHDG